MSETIGRFTHRSAFILSIVVIMALAAGIGVPAGAYAVPTVTGISPNSGPMNGGNTVTITGSGFTGATAVNFFNYGVSEAEGSQSASATNVKVISDAMITVTAPPVPPAVQFAQQDGGGAAMVDVTVTNPAGTSAYLHSSTTQIYFYVEPPAVTSISPASGLSGDTVTISGSGFSNGINDANVNAVMFGSTPAISFTYVNDGEITAIAPSQATGTVDVTVTTPGGTSATSKGDRFFFGSLPVITSITPNYGPLNGGNTVTISGSGFTGTTAVNFFNYGVSAAEGSQSAWATNVKVVSDAVITVTAPAIPPAVQFAQENGESSAIVDVTVTNPAGTSAYLHSSTTPIYYYGEPPATTSTNIIYQFFGGITRDFSLLTGSGGTSTPTVTGNDSVIQPPKSILDQIAGTFRDFSSGVLTETGIIHPTVIAPVLQNTGAGNTPSPSVTEGGSRPDTGGISVRSDPAGAEILLEGTDTGDVTPFMLRDIHPGDYVVTLSLTGYDPANMSVTVRAGETAIVSSTLTSSQEQPTASGTTGVVRPGDHHIVVTETFAPNPGVPTETASPVNYINPGDHIANVNHPVFTPASGPAVTGISPSSGSTAGGDSISITGTGFTGATAVSFGGTPATSFTVTSDAMITAVSPAGSAGLVDITVTSSAGTSATATADAFTYVAPEITPSNIIHEVPLKVV